MPWNACHGGDTWKGRSATKRRTVRAAGPAFATRYTTRACARPDSIAANAVMVSVRSPQRHVDDGIGSTPCASETETCASAHVISSPSTCRKGSSEKLPRSGSSRPSSFRIAAVVPPQRPQASSTTARGAASAGDVRAARTRRRRGRNRRASARSRTDAHRAGGSRAVRRLQEARAGTAADAASSRRPAGRRSCVRPRPASRSRASSTRRRRRSTALRRRGRRRPPPSR